MSLRSTFTRLGIVTAAGALVTSAAVTSALADDGWDGGGDPGTSQQNGNDGWGGGDDPGAGQQNGTGNINGTGHGTGTGTGTGHGNDSGHGGDHDDQRLSRGVVTASELNLRSAPNRGSQVIRVVHRGERVSIFCKTPGQDVQGNRLWYLLTDGTWAWGSARYIETIGTPPRWC